VDNGLVSGLLQPSPGHLTPRGETGLRTALRPAGETRRGAVERCGSADPRSQELDAWLWTVVLACWALPCTSAAADLPSSATVVVAS
jgi:hypothetical protein